MSVMNPAPPLPAGMIEVPLSNLAKRLIIVEVQRASAQIAEAQKSVDAAQAHLDGVKKMAQAQMDVSAREVYRSLGVPDEVVPEVVYDERHGPAAIRYAPAPKKDAPAPAPTPAAPTNGNGAKPEAAPPVNEKTDTERPSDAKKRRA